MRDFSSDHRWLSLNTATVRKQGDLVEIIDACARHGIRAIDPWRDQVAAVGLDRAVRAVRDAGLELSGYCRGGMFTSDAAHRGEVRDDNRRCRRRGQGAGRALHRARRRRPAAIFAAGQRGVEGHRRRAGAGRGSASPKCWTMPSRPSCRWRSSRCIRPMRPTAPASTRRSRRSTSATGSILSAAACSASRSTSITSGGIRS